MYVEQLLIGNADHEARILGKLPHGIIATKRNLVRWAKSKRMLGCTRGRQMNTLTPSTYFDPSSIFFSFFSIRDVISQTCHLMQKLLKKEKKLDEKFNLIDMWSQTLINVLALPFDSCFIFLLVF